ncbi:MAG: hypothetical protein ACLVJO_01320 [[Clostridium] scindens]
MDCFKATGSPESVIWGYLDEENQTLTTGYSIYYAPKAGDLSATSSRSSGLMKKFRGDYLCAIFFDRGNTYDYYQGGAATI